MWSISSWTSPQSSASLVDPAHNDLPIQTLRLTHRVLDTRLCHVSSTPQRLLQSYPLRCGGASAISGAPAGKPQWLLPLTLRTVLNTAALQTLSRTVYLELKKRRLGLSMTHGIHRLPRHMPHALMHPEARGMNVGARERRKCATFWKLGEGAQHGAAGQPSRNETKVVEIVRSGVIAGQTSASFRYGWRSSCGPSCRVNLHCRASQDDQGPRRTCFEKVSLCSTNDKWLTRVTAASP